MFPNVLGSPYGKCTQRTKKEPREQSRFECGYLSCDSFWF